MDRSDRLADVAGAWREALERGRATPPEEVISEHPEIAEDLKDHFAAQALVQQYYEQRDAWSQTVPEALGEHRILREVGRGAMGVVYAARQSSMRREVALKVLFPTIATTEALRKRFEREARATGQMHHTNIVTVHHMGVEGDYLYFVMELVRGRPLDEVVAALRDGALEGDGQEPSIASLLKRFGHRTSYRFIAHAIAGVADALQHAHDQGIIHRDVKPSNLLLDAEGQLKLTDFGLAHIAGDGLDMTATGALLGTPLYMSPEQVRARQDDVDHRTDVYSLGATLYELLTLRRPHDGTDVGTLCTQILRDPPVLLRQIAPKVPKDLATVVAKAMEKEPSDRYPSAGAMARDLRSFADGLPIRARPPGPLRRMWRTVRRYPVRAALGLGLVLVAVTAFLFAHVANEEAAHRRDAEYALLLRRAVEARAHDDRSQGLGIAPTAAVDLYSEAIALDPERRDAYMGRALVDGGTLEQRMDDVDSAEALGLPADTADRLRAYVLRREGRWTEASEVDPSSAHEPADGLGALLAGMNASLEQDYARALPYYARVLAKAPARGLLADLARRHRALDLMNTGEYAAALDDIHALQASGGAGPQLAFYGALAWRRLGKEQDADARIYAILADELESEEAHVVFAETAERMRQQDWLERGVRQGLERHPRSAALWAFRGWAAHGRAAFDEALAAFTKAVELDRARGVFHAWQGLALADRKQMEKAKGAVRRAVELDADDPVVLLALGKVLHAAGEFDEAEQAASRAIAADPRMDVAHVLLAQIRRRQGKLDEALAVLRDVERRAPHSAYVQAELGLVFAALNRHADALTPFSRAADLDPANPQYHHYHGLALAYLERTEEALVPLREAVRLRPDFVAAWYQLGYSLCTLQRWEDGAEVYERLLGIAPDNRPARLELAGCRRNLGRHDDALAIYHALLAENDADLIALQNLAGLLSDQQKFDEAGRVFTRILELAPDNAAAHYNLGVMQKRMRHFDDALRSFARVIELDPMEATAHLHRAGILIQQGNKVAAREALDEAEGIGGDNAQIHHGRAVTLLQLGDYEEAAGAAKRCVELTPANAQAHAMLAQARFQLGEREAAVEGWLRASKLDPQRFQYVQNAAHGLKETGQWREAIDLLDRTAARMPKVAKAHYLLAWLLATAPDEGAREPQKAVAHARAAVKLDDKEAHHRLALGAALYRAARFGEAIEELQRARQLGDDGEFVSFFLAMALHRAGKHQEARKRFDHGVSLRGSEDTTESGSGLVYLEAAKLLRVTVAHDAR